jgi:hypothetical protein
MGCTRPAKPAGLISASLPSQPSLLAVIPAQAGIQCFSNKMPYGKAFCEKNFYFCWMAVPRNSLLTQQRFPACAGMTGYKKWGGPHAAKNTVLAIRSYPS